MSLSDHRLMDTQGLGPSSSLGYKGAVRGPAVTAVQELAAPRCAGFALLVLPVASGALSPACVFEARPEFAAGSGRV